jgi:hypothetical protein
VGCGVGLGVGVMVGLMVGVGEGVGVVEAVGVGVAVVGGDGEGVTVVVVAVFRKILPNRLGVGDCAPVPHLPVNRDNPEYTGPRSLSDIQ